MNQDCQRQTGFGKAFHNVSCKVSFIGWSAESLLFFQVESEHPQVV